MTETIPFLNRIEQQRHYGIDCGDAVCFDSGTWLPGGEHVKHITVKNVSKRTLKFTYELPKTKYFSMEFPILATLSPGMYTTVNIAFRPVKLEAYDDCVVFRVQIIEGGVTATSGKFRLPVLAKLATLSIETPHGIDFGFCPTAETSERLFSLRNNGQIDAVFEWTISGAGDHGKPFAIHPPSGMIKAGESIEQKATFLPSSASVYVATTACIAKAIGTSSSSNGSSNPAFGSVFESQMKLSGISKFTHLSLSESELNFGEILVGAPNTLHAPTEKEFILRNRSLVHATFQISPVETDHDPVFFFSPLKGIVPAESSVPIKVKFVPNASGTFTCDHFDIQTPGGNTVQVTCKGKAMGPMVSIFKKNLASNFVRTKSLNFMDVPVGKVTSRVLTLRNESPTVDVLFHFDCQTHGVFEFDQINGTIPPLLDFNVTVTFAPQRVGNFYRRVFLLIQNQTTLFVDLLGTSFDAKVRPSPFQQAHVDAYRFRQEKGLGRLSPDQLDSLLEEHGDELFFHGALRRKRETSGGDDQWSDEEDERYASSDPRDPEDPSTETRPVSPMPTTPPKPKTLSTERILTRSGEASLAQIEICHEYFIRSHDPSNPIVVDCIDTGSGSSGGESTSDSTGSPMNKAAMGGSSPSSCLDFGSCLLTQAPFKKVIYVTNNTHGKVTCTWRVAMASTQQDKFQIHPQQHAGGTTGSLASLESAFEVFPTTCDINAGGSAEFRVLFQPTRVNSYYFAELEAYVAFKSNRTFRLVNVETFTPPWCVRAHTCGNTFGSMTEQFVSKLSFNFKHNRIHFPPCFLGDSVFQTVCIRNESDTPALFTFVQDEVSQVFACNPLTGLIPANSFHLVQIRFTPQRRQRYLFPLKCIVNNAWNNPEIFECEGTGSLPRIGFDTLGFPKSSTTKSMPMWSSPEVLEPSFATTGGDLLTLGSNTTSEEVSLFIKPTSMGLISSRTLLMQNVSRVPLVFRWEIPSKYLDVFQLTPSVGRLSGNEQVMVLCEFTPRHIQKYSTRLHVAIKPISVALQPPTNATSSKTQPPHQVVPQSLPRAPIFEQRIPVFQETSVKVVAHGTKGMVQFDPPTFEFETILVHTTIKKKIWLVNGGDCDLRFHLFSRLITVTASVLSSGGDPDRQNLRIHQDGLDEDELPDQSHATLLFSERAGCISAHSRKQIAVSFTPNVQGCFSFELCCGLNHRRIQLTPREGGERGAGLDDEDDDANNFVSVEDCFVPKCLVKAEASFPTLLIENIHVPGVPTLIAWNQFQCYEMNQSLQSPNTTRKPKAVDADPAQEITDDQLDQSSASIADTFDICFAPAPLQSKPQQVFLRLTNPVSLVVEYRIRFPKEGNVEMEHWAETGAPSPEEIRTDALMDAKVFTLEPRHATLMPFESVVVTITYNYQSRLNDGFHEIPVTFEVTNGKTLKWCLQGITLCQKEAKLFVPQTHFDLAPVMIGEFQPPPTLDDHSQSPIDTQVEDEEEPEENCVPVNKAFGETNEQTLQIKQKILAKRMARHRRIVVSTMPKAASQQIQLLNVGERPLRVEVDCHQALEAVARDNYGYQVLQRVDVHGDSCTVPPKHHLVLEFAFNPIEAKLIKTCFEVRGYDLLSQGQQPTQSSDKTTKVPTAVDRFQIHLSAMGYHPMVQSLQQVRNLTLAKQPPRSAHVFALVNPASNATKTIQDAMLCLERQCVESQIVSLNADFIDFDHVGMYSSTSRVVALRNHLIHESIEFEWDQTHPLVQQKRVSFWPPKGELAPKEKILVRVIVQSKSQVFIVNHDFECLIRRRIETPAKQLTAASSSTGPSSTSPTRSSRAPSMLVTPPLSKPQQANETSTRRTSVLQRSTLSWENALKRDDPNAVGPTDFPSTLGSLRLGELATTPSMAVIPTQVVSGPPSTSSSRTVTATGSPLSSSRRKSLQHQSFSGLLAEEAAALNAGHGNNPQVQLVEESPVFLHVYAHVLSIPMLERVYGKESSNQESHLDPAAPPPGANDTSQQPGRLHTLPLPLSHLDVPKEFGTALRAILMAKATTKTPPLPNVTVTCDKLNVVGDVLDELVLDAINSQLVKQALEDQLRPLTSLERAQQYGKRATNTMNRFTSHTEDCQSIVESVMENTVFNILQELFHGSMDQELMCVPRKHVFPPP